MGRYLGKKSCTGRAKTDHQLSYLRATNVKLSPTISALYKLFVQYHLTIGEMGVYLLYQNQTTMENQNNTYQVVYSDGVRVLDYITASNLAEAKKIAKENAKIKNYGTAYYKVARCYNGGVRGSSNSTNWH
jgi:hypothetical protein